MLQSSQPIPKIKNKNLYQQSLLSRDAAVDMIRDLTKKYVDQRSFVLRRHHGRCFKGEARGYVVLQGIHHTWKRKQEEMETSSPETSPKA